MKMIQMSEKQKLAHMWLFSMTPFCVSLHGQIWNNIRIKIWWGLLTKEEPKPDGASRCHDFKITCKKNKTTKKKNPNKAITRKKTWLKTYIRKADSLWKYTVSDYRPTDIWRSEEKTINTQGSNNTQVKTMVVGRRITKGGKTNKMGSKTTGDAWNYYPNKTGSDNNRHQGNRERGKTWQEAFHISLLCTSSPPLSFQLWPGNHTLYASVKERGALPEKL